MQFVKVSSNTLCSCLFFHTNLDQHSDNNTTDILCVMHSQCMYTISPLVPFAFISVSLRKQIQKRFSKVSFFRDRKVSAWSFISSTISPENSSVNLIQSQLFKLTLTATELLLSLQTSIFNFFLGQLEIILLFHLIMTHIVSWNVN